MQEFQISANEAGQRLDKFLHKYLKEASTSFLYKMLRKKNITLNKKKAEGKEMLELNDKIQFFFSDETFYKFRGVDNTNVAKGKENSQKDNVLKNNPATKDYKQAYAKFKNIQVIFENEHIALLNKPVGILSQKSTPSDLSLNEWFIGYLLENGQITEKQLETYKPSICNRLDRNTSGLVVCGKSLLGSQTMNRLIKERQLKKFYRTFVKGQIKEGQYLKGFLKKNEETNKVIFKDKITDKQTEEFVPIETAYEPVSYQKGYTYLEVELITGKTHQIRAHLAGMGHPLLGDKKYGDRKWNQSMKSLKIPDWQLLHSYRVEFPKMEGVFGELSEKVFVATEPEIYHTLKEI